MEQFVSQDPRSYFLFFGLKIWFRARKVTETFEKRTPGFKTGVWRKWHVAGLKDTKALETSVHWVQFTFSDGKIALCLGFYPNSIGVWQGEKKSLVPTPRNCLRSPGKGRWQRKVGPAFLLSKTTNLTFPVHILTELSHFYRAENICKITKTWQDKFLWHVADTQDRLYIYLSLI